MSNYNDNKQATLKNNRLNDDDDVRTNKKAKSQKC